MGVAAAYQLGNTSSRTITEVKQRLYCFIFHVLTFGVPWFAQKADLLKWGNFLGV